MKQIIRIFLPKGLVVDEKKFKIVRNSKYMDTCDIIVVFKKPTHMMESQGYAKCSINKIEAIHRVYEKRLKFCLSNGKKYLGIIRTPNQEKLDEKLYILVEEKNADCNKLHPNSG